MEVDETQAVNQTRTKERNSQCIHMKLNRCASVSYTHLYWFEPGERLKADVDFGTLSITGDWLDHMPAPFENSEHSDLDPGPDKLRIESPLLLREKEVVGDLVGSITEATSKEKVVL